MNQHEVQKEQKDFSPEEYELVLIFESHTHDLTLKSLAKAIYATEEQVRKYLGNLGLSDVVSTERVAERRKIKALARQAYRDLARATQDFNDNKMPVKSSVFQVTRLSSSCSHSKSRVSIAAIIAGDSVKCACRRM